MKGKLALAVVGLLCAVGSAHADKLQLTIDHVMPVNNTDATGGFVRIGDYSDVYVAITATPENGTAKNLISPVVDDVKPQQVALAGHEFPVLTVPPRPIKIEWEVRDKDGDSFHLMAKGSKTIPNDGEAHSLEHIAFASDAAFGLTMEWVTDWEKLFGIVCDGENGCLDLEEFANCVDQMLSGHPKVVKYGYRIRCGFAVYENAQGPKRTAADGNPANFTVNDRLNPASVGKTVTAVALLRALEQNGVSIHSSIWNYLPSYWTKHPSIAGITFQQVLSHTSGFRHTHIDNYYFNDLRSLIQHGVKAADKVPEYKNINYALCRVLLAYVDGYQQLGFSALDAVSISAHFQNYVRTELFDPVGIPNVGWSPLTNGTLFHPHASPLPMHQRTGVTYGNWWTREGSAGVQLSVRELSEFLMRMWTPGTYLSKQMLDDVKMYAMGMGPIDSPVDGIAYVKGGYFPGSWNQGAELSADIIKFASGVEAVLVINGEVSARKVLVDCYNASWKKVTINPALVGSIENFLLAKDPNGRQLSPSQTDDMLRWLGGSALNLVTHPPMKFDVAPAAGSQLALKWRSQEGWQYDIMHSADGNQWLPVISDLAAAPRGPNTHLVTTRGERALYRVEAHKNEDSQREVLVREFEPILERLIEPAPSAR